MRPEELQVACPTCGRPVVYSTDAAGRFFPFCSERCRLIDLGKWLDEEHRIPGPPAEDVPGAGGEPTAG